MLWAVLSPPCDSKVHENPDWTKEKTHMLCQACMHDLSQVMIRDYQSWNILLELLERVVFFLFPWKGKHSPATLRLTLDPLASQVQTEPHPHRDPLFWPCPDPSLLGHQEPPPLSGSLPRSSGSSWARVTHGNPPPCTDTPSPILCPSLGREDLGSKTETRM